MAQSLYQFLMVVAFLTVAAADSKCAAGWSYFEGSCYHVGAAGASFMKAKFACRDLESRLVTLTSPGENTFIKSILKDAVVPHHHWIINALLPQLSQYLGSGGWPSTSLASLEASTCNREFPALFMEEEEEEEKEEEEEEKEEREEKEASVAAASEEEEAAVAAAAAEEEEEEIYQIIENEPEKFSADHSVNGTIGHGNPKPAVMEQA
ncbi:low affinity immunoglobulin epsilon fc receptor [Plakobranchus ocellatus]|uniref:Low affinity immunoglobulin epsilon fc receptor n=1 Tax=Plakobranchus ocellatus TaxID=259542 RepID=A0AAV3ZSM8_9GAST|nr:low affinity immunoglobulin epsilon fc receptor [Plakobranchus ocellatus]